MNPSNLSSPSDFQLSRTVAPFLRSLFDILSYDENASIIRWTIDGRTFEIVDMIGLTSVILPKHFKHNRYPSFQRQLNYFGFRKWTKSQARRCTFSNPYFTKHRPADIQLIKRKNKSERARRQRDPMQHMNNRSLDLEAFYQIQRQRQRGLYSQPPQSWQPTQPQPAWFPFVQQPQQTLDPLIAAAVQAENIHHTVAVHKATGSMTPNSYSHAAFAGIMDTSAPHDVVVQNISSEPKLNKVFDKHHPLPFETQPLKVELSVAPSTTATTA